ncbi:hypothetical protein HCN44_006946 [Aphidius gifuensis]|uniref:Uncharacterized protein n=1 Tax=Aphidius gifuensis TaxID=684658 RepID=A0A835CU81_APHGI|nr:protein FAM136A-like [Aphidius gifuensis]KAF7995839.1 hypothetical protein HCN44_006946 [Aphidius gifuensis]
MVEEQGKRVEDAIVKFVKDVDESLTKIEDDWHRCKAKCCDNKSYNSQEVQSCVENCSGPLNRAQQYILNEFERAQNRLQRCVMECEDSIRDKMGPNPSQDEVNNLGEDSEKCAIKCVGTIGVGLLPAFQSAMNIALQSDKFN